MKTILIVDDEPDIRKLLEKRLKSRGFECLTAENGLKAIEIAKNKMPSLIILDLVMPEMDGFEVYKKLKADNATKNIPVIPYTAQSMVAVATGSSKTLKSVVEDIETMDIADFILKPRGGDELVAAVEKLLSCAEKV